MSETSRIIAVVMFFMLATGSVVAILIKAGLENIAQAMKANEKALRELTKEMMEIADQ